MDNSIREELISKDNPAAGKMSKEERFNAYREIYAPDLNGSLIPENAQEIRRAMYATMFANNVDDFIAAQSESTYAFMKFAELNDAYYKEIVKDRNYKEYPLRNSAMANFYIKHYGKVLGGFKNIAVEVSGFGVLTAILIIISGIIYGFSGSNLFYNITNVLGVIFAIQHICGILAAPLDFLMYLPKRIWQGIKKGAKEGFSIFKPLSILFHMAIKLVLGALALIFLPGLPYMEDNTNRLKKTKAFQKYAAEVVDARFARTLKDLKRFREKAGAEVYKNTSNAIDYYSYQSNDIVEDAICRGRDMLREQGSFYFAEKERLEKKIDDAQEAILDAREKKEKDDEKAYDQAFNDPIEEFFDEYPSCYEIEHRLYVDSAERYEQNQAWYERMVKYHEEYFQLIKEEKLTEIGRLTTPLRVLEKRINLAALTQMYICKFNIRH